MTAKDAARAAVRAYQGTDHMVAAVRLAEVIESACERYGEQCADEAHTVLAMLVAAVESGDQVAIAEAIRAAKSMLGDATIDVSAKVTG